jgi:membrane-bound lytic murein transglycosylase D
VPTSPALPAATGATPAATPTSVGAAVPAPAVEAQPAPVDPLRPERPVDIDDAAARSDLWERIRRGFAMKNLDTELVRDRERFYANQPDYVRRMTERGGRYLFHIVEEVERRGLPTELALLPFIESAFNPQALSSARASGIWQFMPATGKHYDLTQNIFRDDRRDVLASTRAALDYLQRLYGMFGDWQLALASYNWGEGNVQRAVTRNRNAGLGTDYLSLSMPLETRHYLPKLQAVKNIVLDPQRYNLSLPTLENHPYFLSVPIARDIDVEFAARLADLPLDEFRALNPQLNKPVILAAGTPQILLPYDNANTFLKRLARHKGPTATWTAWTAPRTLRPAEAARVVGLSEGELREVNRIPPHMLIKAGSTLLVPREPGRQSDVSEHLADHATMALAPELPALKRVSLKAGRRGESVAAVAKRYRVSAAQVAQWNRVSAGASFRAGQSIVVYLPQAAPRAKVSRASYRAPAAARAKDAARSPKTSAPARKLQVQAPAAPAKNRTRVAVR